MESYLGNSKVYYSQSLPTTCHELVTSTGHGEKSSSGHCSYSMGNGIQQSRSTGSLPPPAPAPYRLYSGCSEPSSQNASLDYGVGPVYPPQLSRHLISPQGYVNNAYLVENPALQKDMSYVPPHSRPPDPVPYSSKTVGSSRSLEVTRVGSPHTFSSIAPLESGQVIISRPNTAHVMVTNSLDIDSRSREAHYLSQHISSSCTSGRSSNWPMRKSYNSPKSSSSSHQPPTLIKAEEPTTLSATHLRMQHRIQQCLNKDKRFETATAPVPYAVAKQAGDPFFNDKLEESYACIRKVENPFASPAVSDMNAFSSAGEVEIKKQKNEAYHRTKADLGAYSGGYPHVKESKQSSYSSNVCINPSLYAPNAQKKSENKSDLVLDLSVKGVKQIASDHEVRLPNSNSTLSHGVYPNSSSQGAHSTFAYMDGVRLNLDSHYSAHSVPPRNSEIPSYRTEKYSSLSCGPDFGKLFAQDRREAAVPRPPKRPPEDKWNHVPESKIPKLDSVMYRIASSYAPPRSDHNAIAAHHSNDNYKSEMSQFETGPKSIPGSYSPKVFPAQKEEKYHPIYGMCDIASEVTTGAKLYSSDIRYISKNLTPTTCASPYSNYYSNNYQGCTKDTSIDRKPPICSPGIQKAEGSEVGFDGKDKEIRIKTKCEINNSLPPTTQLHFNCSGAYGYFGNPYPTLNAGFDGGLLNQNFSSTNLADRKPVDNAAIVGSKIENRDICSYKIGLSTDNLQDNIPFSSAVSSNLRSGSSISLPNQAASSKYGDTYTKIVAIPDETSKITENTSNSLHHAPLPKSDNGECTVKLDQRDVKGYAAKEVATPGSSEIKSSHISVSSNDKSEKDLATVADVPVSVCNIVTPQNNVSKESSKSNVYMSLKIKDRYIEKINSSKESAVIETQKIVVENTIQRPEEKEAESKQPDGLYRHPDGLNPSSDKPTSTTASEGIDPDDKCITVIRNPCNVKSDSVKKLDKKEDCNEALSTDKSEVEKCVADESPVDDLKTSVEKKEEWTQNKGEEKVNSELKICGKNINSEDGGVTQIIDNKNKGKENSSNKGTEMPRNSDIGPKEVLRVSATTDAITSDGVGLRKVEDVMRKNSPNIIKQRLLTSIMENLAHETSNTENNKKLTVDASIVGKHPCDTATIPSDECLVEGQLPQNDKEVKPEDLTLCTSTLDKESPANVTAELQLKKFASSAPTPQHPSAIESPWQPVAPYSVFTKNNEPCDKPSSVKQYPPRIDQCPKSYHSPTPQTHHEYYMPVQSPFAARSHSVPSTSHPKPLPSNSAPPHSIHSPSHFQSPLAYSEGRNVLNQPAPSVSNHIVHPKSQDSLLPQSAHLNPVSASSIRPAPLTSSLPSQNNRKLPSDESTVATTYHQSKQRIENQQIIHPQQNYSATNLQPMAYFGEKSAVPDWSSHFYNAFSNSYKEHDMEKNVSMARYSHDSTQYPLHLMNSTGNSQTPLTGYNNSSQFTDRYSQPYATKELDAQYSYPQRCPETKGNTSALPNPADKVPINYASLYQPKFPHSAGIISQSKSSYPYSASSHEYSASNFKNRGSAVEQNHATNSRPVNQVPEYKSTTLQPSNQLYHIPYNYSSYPSGQAGKYGYPYTTPTTEINYSYPNMVSAHSSKSQANSSAYSQPATSLKQTTFGTQSSYLPNVSAASGINAYRESPYNTLPQSAHLSSKVLPNKHFPQSVGTSVDTSKDGQSSTCPQKYSSAVHDFPNSQAYSASTVYSSHSLKRNVPVNPQPPLNLSSGSNQSAYVTPSSMTPSPVTSMKPSNNLKSASTIEPLSYLQSPNAYTSEKQISNNIIPNSSSQNIPPAHSKIKTLEHQNYKPTNLYYSSESLHKTSSTHNIPQQQPVYTYPTSYPSPTVSQVKNLRPQPAHPGPILNSQRNLPPQPAHLYQPQMIEPRHQNTANASHPSFATSRQSIPNTYTHYESPSVRKVDPNTYTHYESPSVRKLDPNTTPYYSPHYATSVATKPSYNKAIPPQNVGVTSPNDSSPLNPPKPTFINQTTTSVPSHSTDAQNMSRGTVGGHSTYPYSNYSGIQPYNVGPHQTSVYPNTIPVDSIRSSDNSVLYSSTISQAENKQSYIPHSNQSKYPYTTIATSSIAPLQRPATHMQSPQYQHFFPSYSHATSASYHTQADKSHANLQQPQPSNYLGNHLPKPAHSNNSYAQNQYHYNREFDPNKSSKPAARLDLPHHDAAIAVRQMSKEVLPMQASNNEQYQAVPQNLSAKYSDIGKASVIIEKLHMNQIAKDAQEKGDDQDDMDKKFSKLVEDLATHRDTIISRKSRILSRRYAQKMQLQKAVDTGGDVPAIPSVEEESESEREEPVKKFRGKFKSIKDKAAERLILTYASHSDESATEMIPDDDASDFEEELIREIQAKDRKGRCKQKPGKLREIMKRKVMPTSQVKDLSPKKGKQKLSRMSSDDNSSYSVSRESSSSDESSNPSDSLNEKERLRINNKFRKKRVSDSNSGSSVSDKEFLPKKKTRRKGRSSSEENYAVKRRGKMCVSSSLTDPLIKKQQNSSLRQKDLQPLKKKRVMRSEEKLSWSDSEGASHRRRSDSEGASHRRSDSEGASHRRSDSEGTSPSHRKRKLRKADQKSQALASESDNDKSARDGASSDDELVVQPRKRVIDNKIYYTDSDEKSKELAEKIDHVDLDEKPDEMDSVIHKLTDLRHHELNREDVLEIKLWQENAILEMEMLLKELPETRLRHSWRRPNFGAIFRKGWQQELKRYKTDVVRMPKKLLFTPPLPSSVVEEEKANILKKKKDGKKSSKDQELSVSPSKNTRSSQVGIIKTNMDVASRNDFKVATRPEISTIMQRFFEKVLGDSLILEGKRLQPFVAYTPIRPPTGLTPSPSLALSMNASDDSDKAMMRADLPASDSVPVSRKHSIANALIKKLQKKCAEKIDTKWLTKARSVMEVVNKPQLLPTPGIGSLSTSPDTSFKRATFFRKDSFHRYRENFEEVLSKSGINELTPVLVPSRTRTKSKAILDAATIKAVFGAEPPVPTKTVPKIKTKKKLSDDGKKKELLPTAYGYSPIPSVSLSSTPTEFLYNDEYDSELRSERSESSLRELALMHDIKKSGRKLRKMRKFRSGFDYIRKKKKTKTEEETILTKKKMPIRKRVVWPENSRDVANEIRTWVINKGLGETVLHKAARLQYHDVVIYCLENGDYNVNAKDNAGYTPLHEACNRGHLDVAQALCAHNANVNVTGYGGMRPLHEAIENGHIELARLLLAYGADPSLTTYSGQSCLSLALNCGTEKFLKDYMFDLEGKKADPWCTVPSSGLDPKEDGANIFINIPPITNGLPRSYGEKSVKTEETAAVHSSLESIQVDSTCNAVNKESLEAEVLFECSARMLPNVYYVRGRPDTYVLQGELLETLSLTGTELITLAGGIETLHLNIDEFNRRAKCHNYGYNSSLNGVRKGMVTLVKYTSRVKDLFKIEYTYVN